MFVASGQWNISNVCLEMIAARRFIKIKLQALQPLGYVQMIPYVEIEGVRVKLLVLVLKGLFHWVLLCTA